MNVVGRVGSLISQGVYSVATPFHPFGGAVDIIVVEQEDGSYRSTPWYVRFGKFQGVLKGAEKIVGISVNGVEANFHMYLDNSGEAYFVKEVESGSEQNESSSNVHYESDIPKLNPDGNDENDDVFYDDNNDNLNIENFEETYGFQDENIVESSQNPNSEMVLISVDGHVLTAPISGNEENTENVQLNTPQFHLGPGDSSGDDFSSDADGWAPGVRYDMDVVSSKIVETCSHPLVEQHNEGKECSDDQQEAQCSNDTPEAEASFERNDPSLDRLDTFRSCVDPSDINADCSSSENLGSPRMKDKEDESKASPAIPDINPQEVYPREVKVDDEFIEDSSIPPVQGKLVSDEEINVTSLGVEEHGVDVVRDASTQIINGNDSVDLQLDLPVLRSCESQPYDNSTSPQQPGICVIPSSEPQSSHESPDMQVEVRNYENSNVVIDTTVQGDTTPNVQVEVGNNENGNMVTDTTVRGDSSCKSDHSSKSDTEEQSQPTEISLLRSADEENAEVEISESLTCQKNVSNLGFEISVCANLLRAGMGGSSANKAFEDHRVSKQEFEANGSSLIKNKNLIVRFNGNYFSWDKAAPIVLGMAVFGVDIALDLKDGIPVEHELPKSLSEAHSLSPSTRGWRLWPNPFRRAKSLQTTNASPDLEEFLDSESISQNQHTGQSVQDNGGGSATINSPRKQFIRTNVPTTEQVASLNLKDGQNMIAFSFSTRVLGKQQVDAHIYLWKWNARIVISDVDGTITKSDVLGQFMPLVGKDWSQSGVARLFCAIKENGYQLLFLSARAIVQAYLTRSFLLNLKQDGKTLPNGPVVISPDGLFPSLYREVIRRAPHEFKIACLEDIKALFPKEYNPFYAGFGNRDTDDLSYRKIGIPKGKIFIINPKGEVAINNRIDVKSYTSLHTLVNDMFPPTSVAEQEDYNSWNYWKMPLPNVDL